MAAKKITSKKTLNVSEKMTGSSTVNSKKKIDLNLSAEKLSTKIAALSEEDITHGDMFDMLLVIDNNIVALEKTGSLNASDAYDLKRGLSNLTDSLKVHSLKRTKRLKDSIAKLAAAAKMLKEADKEKELEAKEMKKLISSLNLLFSLFTI